MFGDRHLNFIQIQTELVGSLFDMSNKAYWWLRVDVLQCRDIHWIKSHPILSHFNSVIGDDLGMYLWFERRGSPEVFLTCWWLLMRNRKVIRKYFDLSTRKHWVLIFFSLIY